MGFVFFLFLFRIGEICKCLLVEWTELGEGEARMPEEGGDGRRWQVGQRGGVVQIEALVSVLAAFPKMSPGAPECAWQL